MPPRTRKSTPPAPSLEDATAEQTETPEQSGPEISVPSDGSESPIGEASNPAEPGQEPGEQAEQLPDGDAATITEPAVSAPEGSERLGDGAEDGSEPEPDVPDNAAASPEPNAYHWESVKNDGTTPCHLCVPGGPPPGVGIFGCSHGQWVRVQDTP